MGFSFDDFCVIRTKDGCDAMRCIFFEERRLVDVDGVWDFFFDDFCIDRGPHKNHE